MTAISAIYVGTYHKYNNGNLDGKWFDLADYDSKEEFLNACYDYHNNESDPELMFQDWEGIPAGMIGESWIDEQYWDLMEYDDDEREVIRIYLDHIDSSAHPDEIISLFIGTYDSGADFAESLFCDYTDEISPLLVIDWERTWEANIRHDYNDVRKNNTLYIYSNR